MCLQQNDKYVKEEFKITLYVFWKIEKTKTKKNIKQICKQNTAILPKVIQRQISITIFLFKNNFFF